MKKKEQPLHKKLNLKKRTIMRLGEGSLKKLAGGSLDLTTETGIDGDPNSVGIRCTSTVSIKTK